MSMGGVRQSTALKSYLGVFMKYAFTRNAFENYEKEPMDCVGYYGIPLMQAPEIELPDTLELVRFDFSKKIPQEKRKGKGLHFYIDDYKFIHTWREPSKYIEFLKSFDFVIAPDFSVYIDFPFALQILAHYRRQWLGAYWQRYGVTVIPNVSWSDEKSFEYCFDGIPKNSIVAVSSAGMCQSNLNKKIMRVGWAKMLEVLQPKKIILYGKKIEGMDGDIVQVDPYDELWRAK